MIKLSDTQRVLLASAAERPDGNLLPLPASLKPGGGSAKAITALIGRELARERQHDDLLAAYRVEDDVAFGVFVTPAGLAALGFAAEPVEGPDQPAPAAVAASLGGLPSPVRQTKATAVLALLGRTEGATLTELVEATGWLPHTTRAALTGLRKKGHDVTRAKRDGVTCYRVVGQAS